MRCVICGGKIEKKKVTFSYEQKNRYLFVKNVPAEVCTNCEEKTYSPEVTDELLKFVNDEFLPVKTIKVPIFDFMTR